MSCRRARRAITEARVRVLSRRAAAALERHLAGCPACREDARFEAALAAGLAGLRGAGPEPLDLADEILTRLRPLEKAPGFGRARLAVLAAGAAVVLAAGAWAASLRAAAGAAAARPLVQEVLAALVAAAAWVPELLAALGGAALDVAAAAAAFAARHEAPISRAGIATVCASLAATLLVVVAEAVRSPRFVSKETR